MRRATPLTRRAAIRFWSDAPSASSWEGPISTRRSPGSRAYAQAGADCLYAPGIRTREQIAAVVAGVAPKPLNLLIGSASELTMAQIAALGVRRVSVGGALARTAWGGFMRAARLISRNKATSMASQMPLLAPNSIPSFGTIWRSEAPDDRRANARYSLRCAGRIEHPSHVTPKGVLRNARCRAPSRSA